MFQLPRSIQAAASKPGLVFCAAGRLVVAVTMGRATGLVALFLVAIPLTVALISPLFNWLDARSRSLSMTARSDEAPALDPRTGRRSPSVSAADKAPAFTSAFDADGVTIEHETIGRPFLHELPVAGGDGVAVKASNPGAVRTLLRRYRVLVERKSPKPSGAAAQGNEQPAVAYRPALILVEVVREETPEYACVRIELAYQHRPGSYRRIPWWLKQGIAPSNELIRIERVANAPFLRYLSLPATAESFTSYLDSSFLESIQGLVRTQPQHPLSKLTEDRFKPGVVHEMERLIGQEFGDLANRRYVFILNTLSGPLQLLMEICLVAGCLGMGLRWGVMVGLERLYRVAVRASARQGRRGAAGDGDGVRGSVERLRMWHGRILGTPSVTLEGARAAVARGSDSVVRQAAGSQVVGETLQHNQVGCLYHYEISATIVFWGLLGSLVFLTISISMLKISNSPARMSAIISQMATQMAQAFLTTVVSSSAARLYAWFQALLLLHETESAGAARRFVEEISLLGDSSGDAGADDSRPVATARRFDPALAVPLAARPSQGALLAVSQTQHDGSEVWRRILATVLVVCAGIFRIGARAVGRLAAWIASVARHVGARAALHLSPAGRARLGRGVARLARSLAALGVRRLAFGTTAVSMAVLWALLQSAGPDSAAGLLKAGGVLMWPIVGAAVLLTWLGCELPLEIRRSRILPDSLVRAIRATAADRPRFLARLLPRLRRCESALSRLARGVVQAPSGTTASRPTVDDVERELSPLWRRVEWLGLLAAATPMVGLAGTVQGMIVAFRAVSTGSGGGTQLAGGIYMALVTTLAGLAVAIPAMILHHILNARLEAFRNDAERLVGELHTALSGPADAKTTRTESSAPCRRNGHAQPAPWA